MTTEVTGMPIEHYHAHESLSRSAIMAFRDCPLKYKWMRSNHCIDNESKKKAKKLNALDFGSLFHKLVLETRLPFLYDLDTGLFNEQGIIDDGILSDIKDNTQPEQFDTLRQMVLRLMHDDHFIQFLKNCYRVETSFFWTATNGLSYKCRPDMWVKTPSGKNIIVDIKTASDASLNAFRYSFYKYGYHIQAAMICDGIPAVTGDTIDSFHFVVIEKEAPYAYGIYELSAERLEEGRDEFERISRDIQSCIEKNIWPAHGVQII